MPVHTMPAAPGAPMTIRVVGRFDFHVNDAFRRAYEPHAPGTTFVVDLHGTEYLDSSALGMLVLLRRHAGGDAADVRIANASPGIRRILQIAKFEKLYRIEA